MLLDLDGEGPRHRQVYRALRRAILGGAFPPGSRLPPTRVVARESGLSRNTILEAFEQLRVEGYLTARTGSGTFVAELLPEAALAVRPDDRRDDVALDGSSPLPLSTSARRLAELAPRASRLTWSVRRPAAACDFRYGAPSFDDFPMTEWSRIVARRTRRASMRRLSYGPPEGSEELREALSRYLTRSRGVRCDPSRIVITHGTQQAINLVSDVLLDRGDRVAVEEPHYPGFTLPLEARGARLVYVDTDDDGLRVDVLARRAPVRLMCVTPSHQFPGGSLMPLRRRLELLELAERFDAGVLEDDYDSEFRYDGRPVACLQGIDTGGRVLYAGSASKLLFPALRIGWLVAPTNLVDAFVRAKAVADTGTPPLDQLVLADFIAEGHLERHVRRQRVRNARRREVLLDSIDAELGDRAAVHGARAGVHVVLWLPDVAAEHEPALRRICLDRGVALYSVGSSYRRPPACVGFTVGYASVDESQIRRGVRTLREALVSLDLLR